MCKLKKCCCCVNLRIGAIIIAIVEIGGGIGTCFSKNGRIELNYVSGVICIIAGLCLLFGSIKYHQGATLAYLVVHMLAIVLMAICMFVFIGFASGLVPTWMILLVVTLLSTQIGLCIYFWSCIFSFYKGLKSGDIVSAA